jgi:hypothetical protein
METVEITWKLTESRNLKCEVTDASGTNRYEVVPIPSPICEPRLESLDYNYSFRFASYEQRRNLFVCLIRV